MTCLIISILSQLLLTFHQLCRFFFIQHYVNRKTGQLVLNITCLKRITHIIIVLILAKFSNDCLFISTIYFISVLNKLLWYQAMYTSKCIGEKHMFQLHYKSTDVDFESFLSLFCHLLFADTKQELFNMSHIICCPFKSFSNY